MDGREKGLLCHGSRKRNKYYARLCHLPQTSSEFQRSSSMQLNDDERIGQMMDDGRWTRRNKSKNGAVTAPVNVTPILTAPARPSACVLTLVQYLRFMYLNLTLGLSGWTLQLL